MEPYHRDPQLDHRHYRVWSTGTMMTDKERDQSRPPWIEKYELVKTAPMIPTWTIEWNYHRWTFTSEEEAWMFADYWKLI